MIKKGTNEMKLITGFNNITNVERQQRKLTKVEKNRHILETSSLLISKIEILLKSRKCKAVK